MDLSRIGMGKQIAAAGAFALILSLFLPWYGADVSVEGFSGSLDLSGWEAMDFADVLLFVAGAVTLALVAAEATGNRPPTLPFPPLQIMQFLGGTAAILVVLRLIDPPDGADLKWGIFLAMAAAAVMTYGSYRAASESSYP